MTPNAKPFVMLNESIIIIMQNIVGICSAGSFVFSEPMPDIIIMPTKISAGAVTKAGIDEIIGVKKSAMAKHIPVMIETSPVRPPSSIPDADSTKHVTVDVPSSAPIIVEEESTTKAFDSDFVSPP